MQQDYAFSERRACRLMMLAVTTYRYRSQRSDEPLRTNLVELARENRALGIGDCVARPRSESAWRLRGRIEHQQPVPSARCIELNKEMTRSAKTA